MNVLLVDDEHLELEQLEQLILQKYPNWHHYSAEDSVEARQLLKNNPISLALVDIHLPGESGLELAAYIKKHFPEIPVIIVTAYQDFDYAKRAIQIDVEDYLVKPIIEEELFHVISKVTNRYQLESYSPLIQDVLNFLHVNYIEKLQLKDIATAAHVSPNYLSRKFTDEVGLSCIDYLNKYRIQKAKEMIKVRSDTSIQFIAQSTGFSSQHHFANSFRKYENQTPTGYRRSLND